MRIGDWSSDVCSSHLVAPVHLAAVEGEPLHVLLAVLGAAAPVQEPALAQAGVRLAEGDDLAGEVEQRGIACRPVDPANGIVLAEGVVVALLAVADLVAEIGRASCRGGVCTYV